MMDYTSQKLKFRDQVITDIETFVRFVEEMKDNYSYQIETNSEFTNSKISKMFRDRVSFHKKMFYSVISYKLDNLIKKYSREKTIVVKNGFVYDEFGIADNEHIKHLISVLSEYKKEDKNESETD